MKTCPHCGQIIPEKHARNFPVIHLVGNQKKIVDLIFRAGKNGIPSDALFERLYLNDAEGGPLTGRKILAVMVWHLNKKLKPLGYKIGSSGQGVPGIYRWEKL